MKKPILPPGYHGMEEAEEIYATLFKTVFNYLKIGGMKGDVLEFGSFKGYSGRKLADFIKAYGFDSHLTLFDSFIGMPEITSEIDINSYEVATLNDWKKGCFFAYEGIEEDIKRDISEVIGEDRIHIVKGYYEDTVEKTEIKENSVFLINIDCDLYKSIKIVLDHLIKSKAFCDGAVILFDDYNFNRANPDMGVRKSIRDTFGKQERYELMDFIPYSWHGRAFFVHDKEYKVPQNLINTI